MRCKTARNALLNGTVPAEGELQAHLSRCHDCCGFRDLVKALTEQGDAARVQDVSHESLLQTRAETARRFARSQPDTVRPAVFSFPRLAAAALLAAVVLAGTWVYMRPRPEAETRESFLTTSRRLAMQRSTLDRKIERLQNRVDTKLDRFRDKHLAGRRQSRLERAARDLRLDIELCTYELTEELAACRTEADTSEREIQEKRPQKEETRYEWIDSSREERHGDRLRAHGLADVRGARTAAGARCAEAA